MLLFVAGSGIAGSQDKSAVTITSPTDGTALSQSSVDVTVSFSASTGGKGAGGNVKDIQLLINQQVVASFNNPPQIKFGTHTFLQVDLSAFVGQTVALVARAFQGNVNANNFTDSLVVNLAVQQAPPASMGISSLQCNFDNTANTLKYSWVVAWANQPLPFKGMVHVEVTFFDNNGAVIPKFIPPDTAFAGGGPGVAGTGTATGSGAPAIPAGSIIRAIVEVTLKDVKHTGDGTAVPVNPGSQSVTCERQT
jgi:hypothetical protein